jgi:hypothetical protein
LERHHQILEQQQQHLAAQVDSRQERAGLSHSMEDFCQGLGQGLEQAFFEQKRKLLGLLTDPVIVDG